MASRTLSTCLAHSATSPASKAFVQLASRRAILTAPVLDFLLPSQTARFSSRAASAFIRGFGSKLPVSQRRAFSATSRVEQTRCIYNPKRDEKGEFMNIEITPRAAHVCIFLSFAHCLSAAILRCCCLR